MDIFKYFELAEPYDLEITGGKWGSIILILKNDITNKGVGRAITKENIKNGQVDVIATTIIEMNKELSEGR